LAVVETSPPRSLGSNDGRDRLMPMTYIIDREVDLSATGVLRMHATMENSSDTRSTARVAIVVNSDSAYGMGRMVELRNESEHQPAFHIFRDIASAEAWLDI
jgi:hypothetical protein